MAVVHGVVCYRVPGLAEAALLSAVPVAATVREVAFGRREGRDSRVDDHVLTWLQCCWAEALAEPSFAADFAVQLTEPEISRTALFEADHTLTQAALYAAMVRALARRAGLRLASLDTLPPLDEQALVVGEIAADGTLFCPPHLGQEIVRAAEGMHAQLIVGPFVPAASALSAPPAMRIQPVRDLSELLQIALGTRNPWQVMQVALEWLALFDGQTQGAEAAWWRETERLSAKNLAELTTWLNDPMHPEPRSGVIQRVRRGLQSLIAFQTGQDREASQSLSEQLLHDGYPLSAVWLLVRRAFFLREQRQDEQADACLHRALAIQHALPLANDTPTFLHQQGRSYYYQGRYAEALQLHWQGYSALDDGARNGEFGADFYNAAGKCFNDLHQLAMALELFKRAWEIHRRLGQDEKLAGTYGSMAEVYWRLGELAQAQAYYRRDLELSRDIERLHLEHHWTMRATNYVANVLFATGDLAGAEGLYQETAAYYRQRYAQGHTRELGHLVYSLTGLAQVAAAQGRWDRVGQLVDDVTGAAHHFNPQEDAACLPVALLAYLNAWRLRHRGDAPGATQWLARAAALLEHLYPAEHAMVLVEQLISAVTERPSGRLGESTPHTQLLQHAEDRLLGFLRLGASPGVQEAFAPIRRDLAAGDGALGQAGQALYARERQRQEELPQHFATVHTYLTTEQWPEAMCALRDIQTRVVFFRDLLKYLV
jgi:tetratricopeptide (TPR) repeat protein